MVGEYTELASAALGERLAPGIEERLLGGFEERLTLLLGHTDERYRSVFQDRFRAGIENAIPAPERDLPLAGASQYAIDTTLRRAQFGLPLAGITASGAAALGIKQVLGVAAGAAAAKTTGKLAGKTLLKTGSGAAAGATAGSVLGPAGAAAGGLTAGVATWFGVDWIVIKADEYLHRDEFESGLREMVEAQERQLAARITRALEARSRQLGGRSLRGAHEAAQSRDSDQRGDQHDHRGQETDRPDQ